MPQPLASASQGRTQVQRNVPTVDGVKVKLGQNAGATRVAVRAHRPPSVPHTWKTVRHRDHLTKRVVGQLAITFVVGPIFPGVLPITRCEPQRHMRNTVITSPRFLCLPVVYAGLRLPERFPFALPLLGVPGAGGTLFTGAKPPVETRKPTAITA